MGERGAGRRQENREGRGASGLGSASGRCAISSAVGGVGTSCGHQAEEVRRRPIAFVSPTVRRRAGASPTLTRRSLGPETARPSRRVFEQESESLRHVTPCRRLAQPPGAGVDHEVGDRDPQAEPREEVEERGGDGSSSGSTRCLSDPSRESDAADQHQVLNRRASVNNRRSRCALSGETVRPVGIPSRPWEIDGIVISAGPSSSRDLVPCRGCHTRPARCKEGTNVELTSSCRTPACDRRSAS